MYVYFFPLFFFFLAWGPHPAELRLHLALGLRKSFQKGLLGPPGVHAGSPSEVCYAKSSTNPRPGKFFKFTLKYRS